MAKKLTALQEAEKKFKETGLPEDELVYLRLLAQEKPVMAELKETKSETMDLANAIIHAVNKSQSIPLRPTKKFLDQIIICDEVILERSEKDISKLTVVETIREGIAMNVKRIATYNNSILHQTRAKVLIPQKDKEKFIESISREIKKINKPKE